MKVLFGMALCQTTGLVENLLRLIGLNWAVPNFGTLSRCQKALRVNIRYCGSQGGNIANDRRYGARRDQISAEVVRQAVGWGIAVGA